MKWIKSIALFDFLKIYSYSPLKSFHHASEEGEMRSFPLKYVRSVINLDKSVQVAKMQKNLKDLPNHIWYNNSKFEALGVLVHTFNIWHLKLKVWKE